MTTDDPWEDLIPPASAEAINARRVDPDLAWDFFWGRDVDNKCLLVLRHSPESHASGRLPRLRGMDVSQSAKDPKEQHALVFRLTDSAHRDIFHRLCVDIVASAAKAKTEQEAVEAALARTWRWHHLLRGGSDERLSAEEQKGLIGELIFLERHLLAHLAPSDAIASWRGPLGAPKDFEVGRVSIEAKARRGAATPFVIVNSEHQLDESGSEALFLFVIEVAQAPAGAELAFTVSTLAQRVSDRFASDGAVLAAFETQLIAAGLRWADDYSDYLWVEGVSRFYHVTGEFPRVTAQQVAPGVSDVRYSVSLVVCEPFAVAADVVESSFLGSH